VEQFSIGKNTQKNNPHFIEMYAALAARHFLLNDQIEPVVLLSRRDDQQVTWDDIPDKAQVKASLANTVRFAFLWVANISPELNRGKSNIGDFQKFAPWFSRFFKPKGLFAPGRGLPDLNDDVQQDAIAQIDTWCFSFLNWVGMVHASGGSSRNVQLFRHNLFLERNGQVRQNTDDFPRLVVGADGLEQSSSATPQSIKEQLATQPDPQPGVVGLATMIYALCKP
jgi:hypothetical protein